MAGWKRWGSGNELLFRGGEAPVRALPHPEGVGERPRALRVEEGMEGFGECGCREDGRVQRSSYRLGHAHIISDRQKFGAITGLSVLSVSLF